MDTGAWFFGKNFGKHKLWPAVSPNKTIEGAVGGCLLSGGLGSLVWYLNFDTMSAKMFLILCALGILSHIGDLIQSKLKRQFEIKDSSSLIPGHGGVYDRFDSLMFVAPFYGLILTYIYKI
jgi:phosphatidate cytidylyltransferase